jgi:hypothetical protein
MFLFTDMLPDDRIKYDVGFYMVYSVVFMMAVNLVVVFFYVIHGLKLIVVKYQKKI